MTTWTPVSPNTTTWGSGFEDTYVISDYWLLGYTQEDPTVWIEIVSPITTWI